MAEKMKVSVPDAAGNISEAVGESMDIISSKEPWSEYVLEDGTKIKARQAAINIVKLDRTGSDGSPVYLLQSQPMMFVIPKI
jgi:hypothetical protein